MGEQNTVRAAADSAIPASREESDPTKPSVTKYTAGSSSRHYICSVSSACRLRVSHHLIARVPASPAAKALETGAVKPAMTWRK